jgi:hypothetical protein
MTMPACASYSTIQPLSFFEANPDWSTEGGGGQLFIYREDTLMLPQNIPWFVNEALRILKQLQKTRPSVPLLVE